jgi:hypothetical protein
MKDALEKYRVTGERKAKKKRFKFYLLLGLSAAMVLLLIFAAKFAISWQGLEVSSISVSNPTAVPNATIITALRNEMLESRLRAVIGPGNILFWGLGVKPSSLSVLPELRSVMVDSNLLKKTVSIDAVPRVPFGVICQATTTTCFTFDNSGVIFSASPDVEGPLILKVNDMTGRNLILGETILPQASWFKNFMSVIQGFSSAHLAIKEVDFNDFSLREWQVVPLQGPIFYFSFDFAPDNLGYLLTTLTQRMNFAKTTYVDFRVLDRIYYK